MSDTNGFRRFSDRLLASASGLVLVLVAIVWSITWHRTDKDVEALQSNVKHIDISQQHIDRRVTFLEAQQQENLRIFQRIENRQQTTEAKIDRLTEKIEKILQDLKK